MNASACEALREAVVWQGWAVLAPLAVLAVVDVMVVFGNCLVIAAVFISSKLRTVTNLFIVSLAVADLLVGLAVLPFSSALEVFKVWLFGDTWCSIWLAVDVWMCTASILNLCAISLDRYLAVTRPVSYPTLMSPGRAKLLIAGVWVLSFVICFPPLVGWKDQKADAFFGTAAAINDTIHNNDSVRCTWVCELTNHPGYVVYSALGSFYLPMLVMLFFYWRIYRAAVQTTRAINQGFRTTKTNRFDEQRLTLRIHRGRSSLHSKGAGGGGGGGSPAGQRRLERCNTKDKIQISVSVPPLEAATSYAVHYTASNGEGTAGLLGVGNPPNSGHQLSPSSCESEDNQQRPRFVSKMGKRNIKAQVKRFRMETKAAKTLGIIVGGFILCWLPFFTMYVVRAFCDECIHPLVFSVIFWLGYCNSAINPCIYALFSKDFRFAFKRIICRCLCNKKPVRQFTRSSNNRRKLGTRRKMTMTTEGLPPGLPHDESDANGSDSR